MKSTILINASLGDIEQVMRKVVGSIETVSFGDEYVDRRWLRINFGWSQYTIGKLMKSGRLRQIMNDKLIMKHGAEPIFLRSEVEKIKKEGV